MAVSSAREIWDDRGGKIAVGQSRDLRRQWRVRTTSVYDDQTVIYGSGQIPQPGSLHPNDTGARAMGYDFRQMTESPKLWIVTVEYSTGTSSERRQDEPENPLERPAEIDWGGSQFRRQMVKAFRKQADGTFTSQRVPIVNSATVPFIPPPEADDSRVSCTVEKNVAQVPDWILRYRNAVNSDVVTIDGLQIPVGVAKIRHVGLSRKRYEGNIRYRTLRFEVDFNEDGWDFPLLDQGYEELIPDYDPGAYAPFVTPAGLRRAICDGEGRPVTSPALLDGLGRKLEKGKDPAFIVYREYARLPFGELPLA